MTTAQIQKTEIKIEELIAKDISLKQSGKKLKGCCPIHNEKTPSFYVFPESQTYKCYGCGSQGDVYNYLMTKDNLTFLEALQEISKETKIPLREPTEKEVKEYEIKQSIQIINNFATSFYLEDKENKAKVYCKGRGLTEAIIKTFSIGYAPTKNSFLETALEKQFSLELLEASGLIAKKENHYDFFYDGRIVFPFQDLHGKVLGFAGRSLKSKEEIDKKKIPKYLNLGVTPIFHINDHLYGLFQAKKQIQQSGTVYLVEGLIDVLAMHQNGFTNTIASSGTELSSQQVKLIKRFAESVTIVRDGDDAGQAAFFKDLNILLAHGLSCNVVILPKDKDPGDYASNKKGLNALIKTKQDALIYKAELYIQEKSEEATTLHEKRKLISEVALSIAKINDAYVRKLYIKDISKKFKLVQSDFEKDVNSLVELDKSDFDPSEHFFRAGTKYYLRREKTNVKFKLKDIVYIPWEKQTLVDDYGKEILKKINRFWGITYQPGHGDKYKQVIDGEYNFYCPLLWEAKDFDYRPNQDELKIKELKHSMSFLYHIADYDRKKFIILLDYIQILYQYPNQALPILLLISPERNTGKSTFLEWMRFVFSSNMTFTESAHLAGQFNSDWMGKLIIACEELKLSDRAEIQDRIKTMSTGSFMKSESKGKDRIELITTPHFMFATNRWDAVKIEGEETRFYPLRIRHPKQYNRNLKEDLKREIPYLFHLFKVRPIYHENVDRAWFNPALLQNKTLQRIKEESRTWLERDIRAFIRKAFEKLTLPSFRMNHEYVAIHTNNHNNIYGGSFIRHNANQVRKFLNNKFEHTTRNSPSYNASSFTILREMSWGKITVNEKGRHYQFFPQDFFSPQELNDLFSSKELKNMFPKKEDWDKLGLKETDSESSDNKDDLPF